MSRYHYTPRVGARAELATAIKRDQMDAARAAGLTEEDLDVIATQGNAARDADRQQNDELALLAAERSGRKLDAREIFEREEQLKARLPAVVAKVAADDPALGRWLSTLSFARYRVRTLPKSAGVDAAADAPEIKAVERVAREDIPTRLAALASFCNAIVQPTRDAIIVELAARGRDRAWVETLRDDADALARQGRNAARGADATAREYDAVRAQSARWRMVRAMIRTAVSGSPELKAKLSEC